MICSPISVTADQRPLVLVEGGRRVQDRVGDGNLADIMQLRGLADLLYVFGRQPGAACALGGELGDVAQMGVQGGAALMQRAEQNVL
jgi:hypothetical protein